MPSIYLPTDEDTTLEIVFAKDKDPLVLDLMTIDEYVLQANEKSEKTGLNWLEEFCRIVEKKHKVTLNKSQAFFLYSGMRQEIDRIKKKLLSV